MKENKNHQMSFSANDENISVDKLLQNYFWNGWI